MPMLRYAGSALRDEAAISQDNIPLSDVSSASVLGRFSTGFQEVIKFREPCTEASEFLRDGYHYYCRGALLPLSSDGEALDHVYGVVKIGRARVGKRCVSTCISRWSPEH